MDRTDLYVAQASGIVAALNYGDADDGARARRYLRGQSLDPWLQKRLDESLQRASPRLATEP